MYLCTSERVFRHCAGQSMMIRASANVIERSNYAVATASMPSAIRVIPGSARKKMSIPFPRRAYFLGQ